MYLCKCKKSLYYIYSKPFQEEFFMTESNQSEQPKKKISLQDAIKQQLEAKKNNALADNSNSNMSQATKKMKSQQSKKISNTRRKMGV
jgi:hypothetical protein